MKGILVHYLIDGEGDPIITLMSRTKLVNLIDRNDYEPISILSIYDVHVPGVFIELHYRGWQPDCLIEFVDDDGNVVVSGYGTDH